MYHNMVHSSTARCFSHWSCSFVCICVQWSPPITQPFTVDHLTTHRQSFDNSPSISQQFITNHSTTHCHSISLNSPLSIAQQHKVGSTSLSPRQHSFQLVLFTWVPFCCASPSAHKMCLTAVPGSSQRPTWTLGPPVARDSSPGCCLGQGHRC